VSVLTGIREADSARFAPIPCYFRCYQGISGAETGSQVTTSTTNHFPRTGDLGVRPGILPPS
jgi:hypothetical protein